MTKTAIVTGHSRGLGLAMVDALAVQGFRVLALARSAVPGLDGRYPDQVTQVAIDLVDSAALADFLSTGMLIEHVDRSTQSILINNAGTVQPVGPAGIGIGVGAEAAKQANAIAQAVTLNLAAPLMLTAAFVAATGSVADRRVAHVSSGAGRSAYAGWSVYCATKAGLDHHARAVHLDAQQSQAASSPIAGLRIASIAPGVVDTAMQAEIRALPPGSFPVQDRFHALKRDGALASPEAAARQVIDHILSDGFGSNPVVDVRALTE